MDIRDTYDTWAATYDSDRNLTRDLDEVVTRKSLAALRCECILEIGCGTGKNTPLLSRIGTRVCAADFSEAMLAQARTKSHASNVGFVLADITQPWPWPDGVADLVACNLVLEHVADLSFVFDQASRVLAPRGCLFICELHPFRQYKGVQAAFQRGQQRIAIPAFVHHISDFLKAAERNRLTLQHLQEWWHEEDTAKPPRLVSFLFEK